MDLFVIILVVLSIAFIAAVVWALKSDLPNWLNAVIVASAQFSVFMIKVIVLCVFQLFVRWTLPRFRYDQVMMVGWKMLLPLALLNIGVTGIVLLL